MNITEKIKVLSSAGKYDICASTSCSPKKKMVLPNDRIGNLASGGICHSYLPSGQCVSLFKVLLSNKCVNDCFYCSNNCTARVQRTEFSKEELSKTFMHLYQANYVEGLFLSSGIGRDEEIQMERMLETVEHLRFKEKFHGYIHLKILPGVSKDKIDVATAIASRVSINVEAPNKSRMNELTSTKEYKTDVLKRMRWIKEKAKKNNLPSGHTTQLVVGPAEETDREIVSRTDKLYDEMDLKRGYFSAFTPIQGTPFEGKQKVPLRRENFLYRLDFMMRLYGIKKDEFVFNENGNLNLSIDPKFAMALESDLFPLDLNEASFSELIRTPGIGPTCAKRISQMQETGFKFSKESELKNLGVSLKKVLPFIELNGRVQKTLLEFS